MNHASSLEALQWQFQRHLLDNDDAISSAIAAGGIGVARRLRIYHHAYRARLQETLRDSFGHTATYLGAEWFDRDALEFIEGHPSEHDSLRWYGAGFAQWLRERHPGDGDIGELAALDWALRQAFDGPDAPVLTLADLGAVAAGEWPAVRLVPHPTTQRMALRFNTLAIWHALDQEQEPPAAQALPQPLELLIWRVGHQPHFRSLGAAEAAAVDAMIGGQPFAALCEQVAESFPEIDITQQAGTLLRRWVDEGLLCALARSTAAVPG